MPSWILTFIDIGDGRRVQWWIDVCYKFGRRGDGAYKSRDASTTTSGLRIFANRKSNSAAVRSPLATEVAGPLLPIVANNSCSALLLRKKGFYILNGSIPTNPVGAESSSSNLHSNETGALSLACEPSVHPGGNRGDLVQLRAV